jgi:glycosyltransferase involved in cell wall biosynthesis
MSHSRGTQPDPAALRDRNIIYFSCVAWAPIKARPQQIAIQLARENRLLYVEPMLSVVSRAARGLESPFPHIHRVGDRLFVYRPPSFLPFSLRSDLVNRINKQFLGRFVQGVARRLDFIRPILGVSHPQHEALIGRFGESFSFYDCHDNYGALPDPRANPDVISGMERRLLGKADHIFISSQALLDAMDGYRGKCTLVRNGVICSHFENGADWDGELPAELRRIPHPIIGYVGTLGGWVDGDALGFLARSRPDWSIVLIGPVHDRTLARKLEGNPNIHLLGTKHYEELPRFVHRFAVGLIPFKLNTLTRSIDPIKLYEYLAAGKPVVASDLPEVRRFGDLVSIYHSHGELLELVGNTLKEAGEAGATRRRLAAMENTWEQRAAGIASALSQQFRKLSASTVEIERGRG